MKEPTEPTGGRGDAERPRRAGPLAILLFVLIPPVAGSVIASLLLAVPGREPWVISGAFLLGIVFFLLAEPLGRRSNGFRVSTFRRMAEASVLLGLTCGAVVVYAVVVHILLGYRTPWFSQLLLGLVGG